MSMTATETATLLAHYHSRPCYAGLGQHPNVLRVRLYVLDVRVNWGTPQALVTTMDNMTDDYGILQDTPIDATNVVWMDAKRVTY